MTNAELPVRKFPIGIQSFESLRSEDYLYIDKTALMYRMANTGKAYFLGRPRRFGKSLLLSTLKAYFEGKRHLFEGLAVERLEKEWKAFPVMHLDLNAELYDSPGRLEGILNVHLSEWEALYGRDEAESSLALRFRGVIRRAAEKTGLPVVVLVDEYDKPLLQAIGREPLLTDYKNILKAFYGVLKSADQYLRFVFLTGVTKFGQVSVFSDLNQLRDISMSEVYAPICGMTCRELEENFQPELHDLGKANGMDYAATMDKMEHMYDGYHFHPNAEGMYNPFSVLNVLQESEFRPFWFQTGTPTFLVELLKRTDYDLRDIDGVELNATAFADYRADADTPIPVIYQSGYLTIKRYEPEFQLYILGFPNDEVRYGFLNFVVPFYTKVPYTESAFYIGKFIQELRQGKTEAFLNRLRAFFADFPYELNDRTERHYQVIFYLVFKLLGQFTQAEVRSAHGRADAVVKTPDYIYVFEFKLQGTAEEALEQIDRQGYLIPYTADGRQLVKAGVSFSAEERNIGRWIIQ